MPLRLTAPVAGLVAAAALASCGHGPAAVAVPWRAVIPPGYVGTIGAGPRPDRWTVGGRTVSAEGTEQVAVWTAPSPSGPWSEAGLIPVPGRDGPDETMVGIVNDPVARTEVALGSRSSPNEGYPRPSTWTADARSTRPVFSEELANRELFGGPQVIAVDSLAGGPHGFTIAGAWIGPSGRVVASVWRSRGGTGWQRDDTDPAFDAGPGTESIAYGAADGAGGLLLVGVVQAPTPASPTRQIGALWTSRDGRAWTRLAPADPALSAAERTVLRAVTPLGQAWLAAGDREGPGPDRPAVWPVSAAGQPTVQPLPLPSGVSAAQADALVVAGSTVYVAGTGGGRILVWRSAVVGDRPARWRLLTSPGPSGDARRVLVAASGRSLVVVADGPDTSRMWQAQS